MDLYSVMKTTLPLMEEEKIQSIVKALEEKMASQSLSTEDLKYAEPKDLYPHLELFQARKFLKLMNTENENSSKNIPCPVISSPAENCSAILKWNRLPQKFNKIFEKKKRPLPSERQEIIRSFADDVLEEYDKPGRKILSNVAKEIVQKYPDSFQDTISGKVVGSGFYSVLVQLENRVANINRKRKYLDTSSTDIDDPSTVQSTSSNEYGCVAWQPNDIPEGDSLILLEQKKGKLMDLFNSDSEIQNHEEIIDLMRSTYVLQRQEINRGITVEKLKMDWPFLCNINIFNEHFIMLTGKNAIESFEKFSTTSVPSLIKFFTSMGPKVKESLVIENKIKEAAATVCEKKVKVIGVLHMLAASLEEDVGQIFVEVEEDSNEKDFSDLPMTPCLITKGISAFYADKYFLLVDRIILHEYGDIISAMAALFSSYFILNIKYNKDVSATMEFIQRVIIEINPLKGSKLPKKKGNRQWNFGSKCMKLCKDIADFNSFMKS